MFINKMKTISEIINENKQNKYRVSLVDCKNSEELPISVDIYVNSDDIEEFENWLNNQEGDTFLHAEGGHVEY